MPKRLTSLDGSFLRVETPSAHMHVAWSAVLGKPEEGGARPTLDALRRSIDGRLRHVPRFRQRLAYAPLRLGEPFWVDDPAFDIRYHVTRLGPAGRALSLDEFQRLTDDVLSRPLDLDRALWRLHFAPALEDGRAGMVCKIHHSLVDGKSAVEVALLLFDAAPDAAPPAADEWRPEPLPSQARLALEAVADSTSESLRAVRGAARLAGAPTTGVPRLADTLRRAALAIGDDLLRPAPQSYLNVPISSRRALHRHRTSMRELQAAKRRFEVTFNDVCLGAVAGAMRELAVRRGETPEPLKVMVPVSVRSQGERSSLGNRISFAFIDLPIHRSSVEGRVRAVHEATMGFKRQDRAGATEILLDALGALPGPVKDRAARFAGSPRVYNLTVSNVPGPPVPVYMLGLELEAAYPVVPLAEGHSLSIGIFSYRNHVHFGIYADPDALPEAEFLPAALSAAILALSRSRSRRPATARRSHQRPLAPR